MCRQTQQNHVNSLTTAVQPQHCHSKVNIQASSSVDDVIVISGLWLLPPSLSQ